MIPRNFNVHLTDLYEYGKSVNEFMSKEGVCIGYITAGRFTVYFDVVGDAEMRLKDTDQTFKHEKELTPSLKKLIRTNSDKIEWKDEPMFCPFLSVEGYSDYPDVSVDVTVTHFGTPQMMKKTFMLALSAFMEQVAKKQIPDFSAVELTAEEEAFLTSLHNYQSNTYVVDSLADAKTIELMIHSRVTSETALLNSLALLETEVYEDKEENVIYLTVSWSTSSDLATTIIQDILRKFDLN